MLLNMEQLSRTIIPETNVTLNDDYIDLNVNLSTLLKDSSNYRIVSGTDYFMVDNKNKIYAVKDKLPILSSNNQAVFYVAKKDDGKTEALEYFTVPNGNIYEKIEFYPEVWFDSIWGDPGKIITTDTNIKVGILDLISGGIPFSAIFGDDINFSYQYISGLPSGLYIKDDCIVGKFNAENYESDYITLYFKDARDVLIEMEVEMGYVYTQLRCRRDTINISNKMVGDEIEINLQDYVYGGEDGVTFSEEQISSFPDGIELSKEGVLSGTFTKETKGEMEAVIAAQDGVGQSLDIKIIFCKIHSPLKVVLSNNGEVDTIHLAGYNGDGSVKIGTKLASPSFKISGGIPFQKGNSYKVTLSNGTPDVGVTFEDDSLDSFNISGSAKQKSKERTLDLTVFDALGHTAAPINKDSQQVAIVLNTINSAMRQKKILNLLMDLSANYDTKTDPEKTFYIGISDYFEGGYGAYSADKLELSTESSTESFEYPKWPAWLQFDKIYDNEGKITLKIFLKKIVDERGEEIPRKTGEGEKSYYFKIYDQSKSTEGGTDCYEFIIPVKIGKIPEPMTTGEKEESK